MLFAAQRGSLLLSLLATAACAGQCGALGGLPPERPPLVKGADGRTYHLVGRGPYKAFYDRWGRLQRLEYDANGDGRADQVAHHDGARTPRTIEVDDDYDGVVDRWEDYDPAGQLVRVGTSRRGRGPDVWTTFGPDGQPARKEYDEDGDGRPDRVETLAAGEVAAVEIDQDRDGRADRWQTWRAGRLTAEELDTDGDGRPDHRLHYGDDGGVLRLEPIAPR
ncbi:MAG TPA: hypothetical protein VMT87_13550 [Vicinamibacteria bacterium]|nr:hypothetical protein [Vicinamibacteria bacterium]